jgi:hypothetical protein
LEILFHFLEVKNPFCSEFNVWFNLPRASLVLLNIIDSYGSLVKKVQNSLMNKGPQQIKVDGSNWSNGLYYCEVVIDNKRMMRKMSLQK